LPGVLLGFAGDGTLLTVAADAPGGTMIIKQWDPQTGRQVGQAFNSPGDGISDQVLSVSGPPLLATPDTDGSIDIWNLTTGNQAGTLGPFTDTGAPATFAISAGARAVAVEVGKLQVAPLTNSAGHLELAAAPRVEPTAANALFLAILDDQTVATTSNTRLVVASPGTAPVTLSPPPGTEFAFLAADTTGRNFIVELAYPAYALPGSTVDPTQPFDPVHDPDATPITMPASPAQWADQLCSLVHLPLPQAAAASAGASGLTSGCQ
jgi:WD40 repeat protein